MDESSRHINVCNTLWFELGSEQCDLARECQCKCKCKIHVSTEKWLNGYKIVCNIQLSAIDHQSMLGYSISLLCLLAYTKTTHWEKVMHFPNWKCNNVKTGNKQKLLFECSRWNRNYALYAATAAVFIVVLHFTAGNIAASLSNTMNTIKKITCLSRVGNAFQNCAPNFAS